MLGSIGEIIEKLALGEDSTIEFKRDIPRRDSLAGEICAFANSKGGIILIGVDDEGEIVGIQNGLNQVEKTVVEICHDSIEPEVQVFTEKLLINDKSVLKIEIPQSLFVHKTPNGYFMRHGSSKRIIPTEQLARLLQSRSQARIIQFGEQFVPNTTKAILQKDLFARFIRNTETVDEENDLLLKRNILADDQGIYRASVAGLLMCSEYPDQYLYNSFICAVCYKGLHKDANYQLDAKDFNGTLDQQIVDAYKFVEKHNAVSARKEIGRKDRPQYSMQAVFEAIVNAVVHRDYSKQGSKIRLFVFADRLEICSPGALANTLTIDNLPYNQVTRNELLARLLSEVTINNDSIGNMTNRKYFLERRGEGVGIILQESTELSGKQPVYEMHDEELHLTIFAAKSLQDEG